MGEVSRVELEVVRYTKPVYSYAELDQVARVRPWLNLTSEKIKSLIVEDF